MYARSRRLRSLIGHVGLLEGWPAGRCLPVVVSEDDQDTVACFAARAGVQSFLAKKIRYIFVVLLCLLAFLFWHFSLLSSGAAVVGRWLLVLLVVVSACAYLIAIVSSLFVDWRFLRRGTKCLVMCEDRRVRLRLCVARDEQFGRSDSCLPVIYESPAVRPDWIWLDLAHPRFTAFFEKVFDCTVAGKPRGLWLLRVSNVDFPVRMIFAEQWVDILLLDLLEPPSMEVSVRDFVSESGIDYDDDLVDGWLIELRECVDAGQLHAGCHGLREA